MARSLSLVWNGEQFEQEGGSDTDESDSEQPLTGDEQIQAIHKSKPLDLPPLPVSREHAHATSQAVLRDTVAVPQEKRTIAQSLAIKMPREAHTIAQWVQQQLRYARKVKTLRAAFCWALNPNRTAQWVCLKSHGNPSGTAVAKGLALHLRMHPFTRRDVQQMDAELSHRPCHQQARLLSAVHVSELTFKKRTDAQTLEAAVMMVALQRNASTTL
tara:strand:- start:225 stop:869 length:645 start_codon:yes stop_codon:yes gene_type:complete